MFTIFGKYRKLAFIAENITDRKTDYAGYRGQHYWHGAENNDLCKIV